MAFLLALALLMGWLAASAANYAADALPQRAARPAARPPRAFWRYLAPERRQPAATRAWALHVALPLLYGALAWRFGSASLAGGWIPLAAAWLYAAFLLSVLVIDLEHRRVLNVMVGPAALLALGLSALPGMPGPPSALLGGLAGFGFFCLIFLIGRGKLGAGDVKLAGVIGLMLGFPHVVPALAAGILLGGVGAVLLLVARRAGRRSTMAYAPYLALGALGALLRLWGG